MVTIISFATIERFEEGEIAVLETELIPMENSNSSDFYDNQTHPRTMIMVATEFIEAAIGEVNEYDVIVVEHNGECIYNVISKADEEKARREAVYDEIMGS